MKIFTKNQIKLIAILIAIFIALNITPVFATDTTDTTDTTATTDTTEEVTFTDFSKATFSITRSGSSNFYLETKNVEFSENSDYIAFLTVGDEEPPIKYNSLGYIDTSSLTGGDFTFIYSEKENISFIAQNKLAHVGDIYLTIVENNHNPDLSVDLTASDKIKTVVEKVKLNRPDQLPLTERIIALFNSTSTIFYNFENNYFSDEDIKYNVKIGRVTDNDLLKSIKNEEASCLQDLLSYAKSATAVYETSLTDRSAGIISNFTLIDGAYYYAYISLDTENGTYYPIEDVMLYQGLVEPDLNYYELIRYLDINFSWNLDEGKPANTITINETTNVSTSNITNNQPTSVTGNLDNTKAPGTIPQTGSMPAATLCILAGILLIGGIAYYRTRKYQGL